MKTKLLFLYFLLPLITFAQFTQIGADIDGEAAEDQSGWSSSISADGSIVAIGAPFNDGSGTDAGHVRVYQNTGGSWTQIGADIDGEAADDWSGFRNVSLSDDGSIVAIGAYQNDGNGTNAGHVRVYQINNGTWTQIGADIDGEAAGDLSGRCVSISADGSIVAIGAVQNAGNGTNAGHVRVYQNVNGTWTQIGADIDGEAANNYSGHSISLSADGSIVAIGAPRNDGINGPLSGHVRVYQNTGGTWTQIGADIDGEAANDRSGNSVNLSADGSIVAIGAFLNYGNGFESGHVRVYQNTWGAWTQIGADIDGEAMSDYSSRSSVGLSDDGSIVAIGAHLNDGNGTNAGHVRVYHNNNGTWTQIGADIDGKAVSDNSGWSVSLSDDGSILAIGAPKNDGNGIDAGHVRVFDLGISCSADFSADSDTLCQGDSLAFTDLSISNDSIINWQWSFEGGTPAASSMQHPVITYNSVGEYDVQLIVSNGILTDTLLQTNFIYVNLSPDPIISGSQSVIPYSEEQYQTEEIPGNTYEWEVTGGDITAGAGSHQVTVLWGNPGEGTLTVTEASVSGCSDTTDPYLVDIGAVSIEENYQGNLSIYPVPSSSSIIVETTISQHANTSISIYSISGQEQILRQLTRSKTEIDVSHLPAGIYIVKVWNDKDVMVRKVIKH